MNILLDGTVFEIPCSGIARATIGLYEAARRLVPSIRMTVLHRKGLSTVLPDEWRTVQWAKHVPLRAWRPVAFPFWSLRVRADVVHFPWNGGIPRMPFPVFRVMTLHDVLPLEIPGYFTNPAAAAAYKRVCQRDLRRAKLVITDSEYSRGRIQEEFPGAEPVTILLDSSLPPPAPASLLSEPYFLYVGGYDPRKGLSRLLVVFERMRARGQISARLVLTGHRHFFSDEFRAAVSRAVASGAVIEAGQVSDADLSTWMGHALALLYPSQYEGFGLPPLEAMRAGCPVVTTKHTSLPEVCDAAVIYADAEDEPAWEDAIMRLERDRALRVALRSVGVAQASRFSWEKSARYFLAELSRRGVEP